MIIHNPILTGSFTVNGTDVASITSSAASITAINSYTASQNILNGTYTLTSSFAAQTASFTAFTSSVNSFTASQLVLNGTYATTGSNTFAGIQTVNSNLIVTGSITAQTLVVQTITSSIDFVTGSTRFGSILGNTHQFTGSVSMTGSLAVVTNGTEFQVTSTGVNFGNVIGDTHSITGSVNVSGSLSGSSATFSGNLNQNAPIFLDNSNHELASFSNNNLQLFFSSIYDGTNIIAKSGAGGRIVMNGGSFSFQTFGSATTGSAVTPTEKFLIANNGTATFSGSVGIGTTSPSTLMHINTARSSGTDVNIMTLSDNVAGVQTSGFGVRILATSNNGQAKSAIAFEADGGTNNDTAIAFYTQTSAASLDRRMTINKNGNVGIGTSSPNGNLEVYAATPIIISGASSSGTLHGLEFRQSNTIDAFIKQLPATGELKFSVGRNSSWGGNMTFFTDTVQRMNIPSTGGLNVLTSTGDGFCIQFNSGFKLRADSATQLGIVNSAITDYADLRVKNMTKASGTFRISHPLESLSETHDLVHSFIEGPRADLIYRGKVTLINGIATINIDTFTGMTEGTFVALNRDIQCFTTNESGWDLVKGKVEGNILTITSQNTESTNEISWMVVGERQDKHIKDTDWTDENGKPILEPSK
jgi:uncharacterized glyoxalase superfamily protein PhnB